jgi:hypothetical protein
MKSDDAGKTIFIAVFIFWFFCAFVYWLSAMFLIRQRLAICTKKNLSKLKEPDWII